MDVLDSNLTDFDDAPGRGVVQGAWSGRVPAGIVAIFVWLGAAFAVLYLLGSAQGDQFRRWQEAATEPSFWSAIPYDVEPYIFIGTIIAGIVVIVSSQSLAYKLGSLALVLWAMVAGNCLLWQSYYGIQGSQVVIHSAWPGQPLVRFALADAQVLERGCRRVGGKRIRHHLIFRVHYGPGAGDTIDLGAGAGPYTNQAWLAAMGAYTSGAIPLTATGPHDVPRNPACIAEMSHGLNPQQREQMRRLIG